ncbi:MAG: hypothetical protein Q9205_005325 [Flavoplaca limonia]
MVQLDKVSKKTAPSPYPQTYISPKYKSVSLSLPVLIRGTPSTLSYGLHKVTTPFARFKQKSPPNFPPHSRLRLLDIPLQQLKLLHAHSSLFANFAPSQASQLCEQLRRVAVSLLAVAIVGGDLIFLPTRQRSQRLPEQNGKLEIHFVKRLCVRVILEVLGLTYLMSHFGTTKSHVESRAWVVILRKVYMEYWL